MAATALKSAPFSYYCIDNRLLKILSPDRIASSVLFLSRCLHTTLKNRVPRFKTSCVHSDDKIKRNSHHVTKRTVLFLSEEMYPSLLTIRPSLLKLSSSRSAHSEKLWYQSVFNLSVVCLMTHPLPLPKWVFQTVWSSVSSFNFQYLLFSLRSSGSGLLLYLIFPSHLSFNNMFQRAVPTQDVTNPVSLPSFYCL